MTLHEKLDAVINKASIPKSFELKTGSYSITTPGYGNITSTIIFPESFENIPTHVYIKPIQAYITYTYFTEVTKTHFKLYSTNQNRDAVTWTCNWIALYVNDDEI